MSTGTGVKATATVLAEAAADVRGTEHDLRGILAELRGRLDALNTTWRGRGGTAFQGAINAWQNTADRVIGHMDEFHASLVGADRTYDESEDLVTNALNRYQGRL